MFLSKLRSLFLNEIYRKSANGSIKRLLKDQKHSPDEHRKWQMESLSETLVQAQKVPYYYKYLEGIEVYSYPEQILRELPILEKRNVLELGDQLINHEFKVRGIGTTSGSTGIGLKFFYDDYMLNNSEVLTRYYRSWYNVGVGDRGLKIWGRPLRGIKNKLHSNISNLLRGFKTIDPWNLTPENIAKNWKEIIEFNPEYVYGYATSIAALSKWVKANSLQEKAHKMSLKVIISTAETLFASDKKVIKEVFGCPVVEEYGAAEVSIIAFECPEGNLHISTSSLYLECVDDNGNLLPLDTPGHILVTSFVNKVQPLIRYRIGDYGTLLSAHCACGRGMPIMKLNGAKIIEMIKTENGRIFSAEILDYINLALLKDKNFGIKQFRVTQKTLKKFEIEVVPASNYSSESKSKFTNLFMEQIGDNNLSIIYIEKDKIQPMPNGKLLYFKSEIV